jgi:basic amino acid/polyamine antiporter, APA family
MKKEHSLKRELGLFEVTLCGIGIILGAGIYALVGKAAALGGNGIWMSFLIAAIIAIFTGLSYAELASMFPKAGAEYVYTKKAFGKRIAFIVGWLIIAGGTIAAATVALGFAGYFSALFSTPIIPTAIVLILLLSFIVFKGIKQSVWLAISFTLIEIAGLILIIFVGIPYFGSVNYFEIPSFNGVFAAAALIFFAFIGFEQIVRLSEETKNPQKVIPLSLIIAIAITTIIYILVAISSVSVLNWEVLGASKAPLSMVVGSALGGEAFLVMSVIALFATANTVLLMLLATSRITYGMAKSNSLPSLIAKVHKKTRTPWVAILLLMIFSILFILIGDIELVANLANFTVFLTFIVINISLIWLRYKQPALVRSFKVPLNIGKFPILAFLGALFSLVLMFSIGFDVLLYGSILTMVGLLIYEFVIKAKE